MIHNELSAEGSSLAVKLMRVANTTGVLFEGSTSDDGSLFNDYIWTLDSLCCSLGLTSEGPSSVSIVRESFSQPFNSSPFSLTSLSDDLRQV